MNCHTNINKDGQEVHTSKLKTLQQLYKPVTPPSCSLVVLEAEQ